MLHLHHKQTGCMDGKWRKVSDMVQQGVKLRIFFWCCETGKKWKRRYFIWKTSKKWGKDPFYKPLSEPMLTWLTEAYKCSTRGRWVNWSVTETDLAITWTETTWLKLTWQLPELKQPDWNWLGNYLNWNNPVEVTDTNITTPQWVKRFNVILRGWCKSHG